MLHFLQKELEGICLFLRRNRTEAVVAGVTALSMTLNMYHPVWNGWFSHLLYYAFLPILAIPLLRKKPVDFGFGLGNPRIWGFYVAITCLMAIPILYIVSRIPSFQSYYRIEQFNLTRYFLTSSASLFASEFLFRGFLLFGLKEKLKEGSIFAQMLPFVIVHFSKPELETLSTIGTGIYFGYIAYRGKSFWPVFIIHMFINVFFLVSVNLL